MFAVLLTPVTLSAEEKYDALYIMSSQAPAYMAFKETVQNQQGMSASPPDKHHFVTIDDLPATNLRELINNSQIVITLGQKSLHEIALWRIDRPHIATLLTLEDYRNTRAETSLSQSKSCALVIDQPMDRIKQIIHNKLPDIRIAGIIDSPTNMIGEISDNLSQEENDLKVVRIPLEKNIHATIKALSQSGADAIIARHNKQVYNSNTARNILISSYHFNLPLIGYSSAFVKAGALIGIYSTPESVASDVIEIIQRKDRCHRGNIFYPSGYAVEINPQVARSLGITIDTSNLIQTYQERPRK